MYGIPGKFVTSGYNSRIFRLSLPTGCYGSQVERTVMMTEEEYNAFQASGGDKNFLKKFMGLADDEEIEAWEKASTVYAPDSDDEQVQNAKVGTSQ